MAIKRVIKVDIDLRSADAAMARWLDLASSGEARKVLADCLHEACDESMIGEMRGRASSLGKMHAAAAAGLNYSRLSDGVSITAGGVEWVAGSEFGGRVKIATYQSTSRKGKRYVMTRHTTQQFNAWRGQKGYWLWPTVTDRLQGIREKLIMSLMDRAA